jgi:signal transduction histidine kinase
MKNSLKQFYRAVAGMAFLGLLVAHDVAAAGQGGTAEEAKAMLERAVAAVKADEPAALKAFTADADGFKDRDLYVFCGGPDSKVSAHGANPALIGNSFCGLVDKAGKKIGEEFCKAAEGKFSLVEYVWPRPGETKPVPKASYVTKVGDQICGVGYYK